MLRRRVRTRVEQYQLFERGRIVGLRQAGWTYRRIVAHVGHNVSVVYRYFQQCSGLWKIPTPADQVLDGRVVQTHCGGRPNRVSRAHVARAVSPRTMGTVCLRHDSVCPGYHLHHDTIKHSYSGVVSDERRFCLYESDGRTRVRLRRRRGERHLPECIRPRHTDPTAGFMMWGAISCNSRSYLVFLQGKSKQVVNPVLLPFLRQEDVLFLQDNARPHTTAPTQRALRGVQQLTWPERSSDLSPIEHVWDMMK